MSQTIIEIKNLTKSFGSGENKTDVLKNINLNVKAGEFIAIIGASGSGKSTLMNILGCLDTATSGDYIINKKNTTFMNSDDLAELRRQKFGFIFQRYNLLSNLSALENVALPAIYSGVERNDRLSRASSILTSLGLSEKLKNKPSELSGGQQQRVSIGRALMNGGEIILADEPTGALDSHSGENVMDIIRDLNSKNHTIILVTHDKNIASYADRVIEIKDGEIISDTSKKQAADISVNMKSKPEKQGLDFYKNQFIESFKMAINAISSHKLRSFLTMLGIIIGITSVVSIVALGNGSQQKILANINSMGTNTIDIYPGSGFGDMRSGMVKTLTDDDSKVLGEQSYINSSTPNASTSGVLAYKNIAVNTQVNGVGAEYFNVKGVDIAEGSKFYDSDVRNNDQVAVIDPNTKKKLFPNEDPIGRIIFINKKPLKVIGVSAEKKSAFGNSDNLNVWTPYTTVMYRISGDKNIDSITVKVKDNVSMQAAEKSIIALLKIKHGGKKDFFTMNTDSIKQTVESTTNTMTLLISSIAVIALIVGGIGVMNIMLVSVTERTKEIGIRMAIGARETNILQQFLIEAVLICLIGGAIGIALSYMISIIFNNIVTDFAMSFSITSIVMAVFCSTMIGVVFGFMPARNASKLNPINALSRE